jgi:peptidoglycan/LPS O-acetylase OafA/YrhL
VISAARPLSASPKGAYVPALDGLRAWAVVLVVAFHARVIPGGFVGVDVFFVLSAFLITGILQRELSDNGRIALRKFYVRRALRLGPALMLMLLAYVTFAPMVWPDHPHLVDATLAALYISNYTYAFLERPAFIGHTWSLSVEEQFYLIWPILLPLLMRARNPILWLAVAYLSVMAWRASFGGDWHAYYYRFDTRCTGLILGAALALSINRLSFTPWHAFAGAALIALAAIFGKFGSLSAIVFPAAEIGAVLLVGAIAQGQIGRLQPLLCSSGAIMLGKLSYGIYLWHYPITVALRPSLEGMSLFLAVLVPSIMLAWVSFVTVERLPQVLQRRALVPSH